MAMLMLAAMCLASPATAWAAQAQEALKGQACLQCHRPHSLAQGGDVHARVSCQACHSAQGQARREGAGGRVEWSPAPGQAKAAQEHEVIVLQRPRDCRRCHRPGNLVGASAMVLPVKGVLCLPCHPATPGAGDPITAVALILLGLGAVAWVVVLLRSGAQGGPGAPLAVGAPGSHASRLRGLGRVCLGEVLLVGGLWRESRARWLAHALVFYPLLLRLLWSVAALLGSEHAPGQAWPWLLLDPGFWLTALVFDLSGLLILTGLVLMWARGGASQRYPGLRARDRLGLALLAALVVSGFLTECLRLAMAGMPPGSGFSFVGSLMALPLRGLTGLTMVHGYLWYSHAVLTGLVAAYLPFSNLFHIFTAPLTLLSNAARRTRSQQ